MLSMINEKAKTRPIKFQLIVPFTVLMQFGIFLCLRDIVFEKKVISVLTNENNNFYST